MTLFLFYGENDMSEMNWIKDVSERYGKLLDKASRNPRLTWQDVGILGWLLSRGEKGTLTEAEVKPYLDEFEDISSFRPSLKRLEYYGYIHLVERTDNSDPFNTQKSYSYEVLT
jgi:hypothetical protein